MFLGFCTKKVLINVFKMLFNHYPLLDVDFGHVCSVSL